MVGHTSIPGPMSPLAAYLTDSHPFKVPDLVGKFDVTKETIREWAKAGRLKGAKKRGRDWRFPLDVEYVDTPKPATPADRVRAALERLDGYQIGAPRTM